MTLAYGRIYGVTATRVFALDASRGRQVWYRTSFGGGTARFDIAPQVANQKVFVASLLTQGGGIVYALDAGIGATDWSLQPLRTLKASSLGSPRVAPGILS